MVSAYDIMHILFIACYLNNKFITHVLFYLSEKGESPVYKQYR